VGKQGASTEGYAGVAGDAGPQGARGEAGPTGARGPTLVGPAGPAGLSGAEGERGVAGVAGARGEMSEGVAGASGRSGASGERGPAGPAGDQGVVGVVDRWTSYREIRFDADKAKLDESQSAKLSEVADYLKQNPSLQVGIDATVNTRGADPRIQRLCDDRVATISDALIAAGVPQSKIKAGSFGDPKLRRDGRVEVLISTANERAQADQ
jgi:outer membrane protein OmpA-like peptidoglycan-associated protein